MSKLEKQIHWWLAQAGQLRASEADPEEWARCEQELKLQHVTTKGGQVGQGAADAP